MRQLKFIDLFAGLGGFHLALKNMGHNCVFASEINEELRDIYEKNFGMRPAGDLRKINSADIPSYDILCAGFPCQPFSKAGEQLGTKCKIWGDLFGEHVLRLVKFHYPRYLIFENVANLERHDGGRTWTKMKWELTSNCGYEVKSKVLSPHRFGIPQIRERLFIVASRSGLEHFEWPNELNVMPSIYDVLDKNPPDAKPLSDQVLRCLKTWQEFMDLSPGNKELPSFPIWSMEFGATYPYTKYSSLHKVPLPTLRNYKGCFGQSLNCRWKKDILERLPSYARSEENTFPQWKQLFIQQNRDYYRQNKHWIQPWLPRIREFPSSLQKFEWNCLGEERNIWNYIIQFRASGVRVKRPTTSPSLVAMTSTQVPIIAWEKRYMTPRECCRLQGMESLKHLPFAQTNVVKALGNAVNAELVYKIADALLHGGNAPAKKQLIAA